MSSETNVIALQKAMGQFETQAAFIDALNEHLMPEKAITRSRIRNWLVRDGGAPAAVCPSIEAVSGVKCEELCDYVRWDVLRGTSGPVNKEVNKHMAGVDVKALPANNESYLKASRV